jgi:hypothetical protein
MCGADNLVPPELAAVQVFPATVWVIAERIDIDDVEFLKLTERSRPPECD